MADAPSYTTVPGRIPALLAKVKDTGVPAKATAAWLKSLGFTSSNDRTLLRPLRQIGFIDGQGVPTPAWREYRGAEHRKVLGRAIVLGYQVLYNTYGDAHNRSNTDLANVFSTKTTAGKQVIDLMVSTFKNLASQADFAGVSVEARTRSEELLAARPEGNGEGEQSLDSAVITRTHTRTQGGFTVNVNVQLTLPETTNSEVYEAFFASMRKHLIDLAE